MRIAESKCRRNADHPKLSQCFAEKHRLAASSHVPSIPPISFVKREEKEKEKEDEQF